MDKGNLHPFPSLFIRICFSLIIYIFCISAHANDTGGFVTSVATPDPIPVKFNPYPDPIQPPPPSIEYAPPQAAEGKAEPLLPSPTLPELDHVVQGRLDIVKQDTHMDMMQGQEDVVANFRSFNIGDGHSVHLHQHQGTRAFFRVINQSDITTINGIFKADGTVYLVTPNGLLIGPNGVLDMQNVLLTTHDISNAAFLNLPHTQTLSLEPAINPGAIISNHGTIQTSGFAALVAPTVRNAGLIQGNIFVGAGGKADLSFAGNDLIQMRISGKLKRSLIDQRSTGKLSAQGKKVLITAGAVEEAANGIINLRGTIDASDGQIIVEGAENTRLKVHGDLSVEGTTGKGGKIYLNAPITHIEKTATLNASSQDHQGGDINVFGAHIGIYGDKTFQTRGALLDASGGTGGGTILVGGGKRGQGDEPHAKSLFVDYGTTMKADSTRSGDAGDIVLWSDTVTRMYGFNSASALGENGGAGTIEWSGKKFLHFEQRPLFYPKLKPSPFGKIGTMIIDPSDISIEPGVNPYNPGATGYTTVGASWIIGQLGGSDVTLTASSSITVNGNVANNQYAMINGRLTLQATGSTGIITIADGKTIDLYQATRIIGPNWWDWDTDPNYYKIMLISPIIQNYGTLKMWAGLNSYGTIFLIGTTITLHKGLVQANNLLNITAGAGYTTPTISIEAEANFLYFQLQLLSAGNLFLHKTNKTFTNFELQGKNITIGSITLDPSGYYKGTISSPTPGGTITFTRNASGPSTQTLEAIFKNYEDITFTNQGTFVVPIDANLSTTLNIFSNSRSFSVPVTTNPLTKFALNASTLLGSDVTILTLPLASTFDLYTQTPPYYVSSAFLGGDSPATALDFFNRNVTINGNVTLRNVKNLGNIDFNPNDTTTDYHSVVIQNNLIFPTRSINFHNSYVIISSPWNPDTYSYPNITLQAQNITMGNGFDVYNAYYNYDITINASNNLIIGSALYEPQVYVKNLFLSGSAALQLGSEVTNSRITAGSTLSIIGPTTNPLEINMSLFSGEAGELILQSPNVINIKNALGGNGKLTIRGNESGTAIPSAIYFYPTSSLQFYSPNNPVSITIKAQTITYEGNGPPGWANGIYVDTNYSLTLEATASLIYTGGSITSHSPLTFKAPGISPNFLSNITQATSILIDTDTTTISGTITPNISGLMQLTLKTTGDLNLNGTLNLTSGTLAFETPANRLKLIGNSTIGASDVRMTSPIQVVGGPWDLGLLLKGTHVDRTLNYFVNTAHTFRNLILTNNANGQLLINANPVVTQSMDLSYVTIPSGTTLSAPNTATRIGLWFPTFTGGSVNTHSPVEIYGTLSSTAVFSIISDNGSITFQSGSSINASNGFILNRTVALNGSSFSWSSAAGAMDLTNAIFKSLQSTTLTLSSSGGITAFNPSLAAGSVGPVAFDFGTSPTTLKSGTAPNAIPLTLTGTNMRLADNFTYTSTASAGLTLGGVLSATAANKSLILTPDGPLILNATINNVAGYYFQTIGLALNTTLGTNASITASTIALPNNAILTAMGTNTLGGTDGTSTINITTQATDVTKQATIVNPENITFTNQRFRPTVADTVTLNLVTDTLSLTLPPSVDGDRFGTVNIKPKTLSGPRTITKTFSTIPKTIALNIYADSTEKDLLDPGSTVTIQNADLKNSPLTVNFPYTTRVSNLTNVSGLTFNSAWAVAPTQPTERVVKVMTDLTSTGTIDFKKSQVVVDAAAKSVEATTGNIIINHSLVPNNNSQTLSITAAGSLTIPGTIGTSSSVFSSLSLASSSSFSDTFPLIAYANSLIIKTNNGQNITISSNLFDVIGTGGNRGSLTLDSSGTITLSGTLGASDKLFESVTAKSVDSFSVPFGNSLSIYGKTLSIQTTGANRNINFAGALSITGDGTGTAIFDANYRLILTGALTATGYTAATLKAGNTINIANNISASGINFVFDRAPTVVVNNTALTTITAQDLSFTNGAARLAPDNATQDLALILQKTTGSSSLMSFMNGTFRDLSVTTANPLSVSDSNLLTGRNLALGSISGITLSSANLTSGGTMTINGPLSILNTNSILTATGNMSITGAVTATDRGVTLSAAGQDIRINGINAGSLTTTSTTLTFASGSGITTTGNTTLNSSLQLTNTHTIASTNGSILLNGTYIGMTNATAGTLSLSATPAGTMTVTPRILGSGPVTIAFGPGISQLLGDLSTNPSTQPLTITSSTESIGVSANLSYTSTNGGLTLEKSLMPLSGGLTVSLKPRGPLTLVQGIGNSTGTRFASVVLGNSTAQTVLSIAEPTNHVVVGGDVYGATINVSGAYVRLTKDIVFNSSGALDVNDFTQFEGTANNAQGLTLLLNAAFTLPSMGNVHPLRSLTVNTGNGEIDFSNVRPIYINGDRTLIANADIHLENADSSFLNNFGTLKIKTNQNVTLPNIGQTTPVTKLDLSEITGTVILGNVKATESIILPSLLNLRNSPRLEAPTIQFNNANVTINGGFLSLIGNIFVQPNTTFTQTAGGLLKLGGSIRGTGTLTFNAPLELLQDIYLKSDSIILNPPGIQQGIAGRFGLTIEETAGFTFNDSIGTALTPLTYFVWRSSQSLRGRINADLYADYIKLWTPDMHFGPGLIHTPHLHLIPTWAGVPSDQRVIAIQNADYPFQIWRHTIQNPAYFDIKKMTLGDPNARVPIFINNAIQNPGIHLVLYGEPIYIGLGFDHPKNVEFRGTILRDKAHNDLWNSMQEFSADYDISPMEGALNSITPPENIPMAIIPLGGMNLKQQPINALQDGEAEHLVGIDPEEKPLRNIGNKDDEEEEDEEEESN